jgi:hypothetical protein
MPMLLIFFLYFHLCQSKNMRSRSSPSQQNWLVTSETASSQSERSYQEEHGAAWPDQSRSRLMSNSIANTMAPDYSPNSSLRPNLARWASPRILAKEEVTAKHLPEIQCTSNSSCLASESCYDSRTGTWITSPGTTGVCRGKECMNASGSGINQEPCRPGQRCVHKIPDSGIGPWGQYTISKQGRCLDDRSCSAATSNSCPKG